MAIDYDKLRKLAEAATPGHWQVESRTVFVLEHRGWYRGEEQLQNRFYALCQGPPSTPRAEVEAGAAYIAAANPAVMLALLDRIKTLEDSTNG